MTKRLPEKNEQVGEGPPPSVPVTLGWKSLSSTTVRQQHLDTTLSWTNSERRTKGLTGLLPNSEQPGSGRDAAQERQPPGREDSRRGEVRDRRRWCCRRGGPADGPPPAAVPEERPPRMPTSKPRTLSQAEGTLQV